MNAEVGSRERKERTTTPEAPKEFKKRFREASERPIGPEESREKRKERSGAALWCSEAARKSLEG